MKLKREIRSGFSPRKRRNILGTGNGSKDFLGLEAIVDDGTNAATYGTLTRASYDPLDSTVTASSGTLTLAKMATLYSDAASGSVSPTASYVTEAIFNFYEELLQPQERITKTVSMMKGRSRGLNSGGYTGGTGFTALTYKGMPVLADEKCTAQVMYFVNEDFLDFYALPFAMNHPVKYKSQDIEGNDYSEVMGLGFSWSKWIRPINSASITSHIHLSGEFLSANPKRHAKLTGITGV